MKKNLDCPIYVAYMTEKYFSEFEVIDGLNQHPSGLTFEQWI